MANILNRSLAKSNALWKEANETILSGCQLYSKGPETHIMGVSPIYIILLAGIGGFAYGKLTKAAAKPSDKQPRP